jgi:uncharacterized paraquat-inducible protein A
MDIPNGITASDSKPTCALCGQPLDAEKRLSRVALFIRWSLLFASIAFFLSRIG